MKSNFAGITLTIALCGVLGGYFGPTIPRTSAAELSDVPVSLETFSKVFAAVESNFADKVSSETAIYHGAIPGMLRNLDPHCTFLDPKEYADMQQKQRGNYGGVGMEVNSDKNNVVVARPFHGSPAEKAGLKRGDVIVKVDDKNTLGMEITKVTDLLKGPRGTPVQVTVQREGAKGLLTFTVKRDQITPSLVDQFWLQPGIAYIRIQSFESLTINADVSAALRHFGEKNIKGLILDLRGNPGGLVNQAVDVADHFLAKGQKVVSHHGRAEEERVFVAKNGRQTEPYPMVVLVDRNSASASEIVSGALQDHDRAWILGETTFGKGLVQAQFPLSEGAALLLTIAHYYTPSGRLIQRDYSKGSFFDYYYQHQEGLKNEKDVKMTDSGRTMYGGGGITPDEKFKRTPYNQFQRRFLIARVIFHYGSHYFATHPLDLPKEWAPDEATIADFRQFALHEGVPFVAEEFNQNKDWVANQIQQEFLWRVIGREAADWSAMVYDPEVKQAIASMPKATDLLNKVQRAMAARQ